MSTENQIIWFIIATTGLVLLLAALVFALLLFYYKRQEKYKKELALIKMDYEKNLLRATVEIQEQTFGNISREIHDHVNLELTLAKLNLNTLNLAHPSTIQETVGQSVQIITDCIGALSDLSRSLNTEQIAQAGMSKAIENELARVQNITQIQTNLQVTGDVVFLESDKELIVFRIIQEALNNVVKHARASKIELRFCYKPAALEVLIEDNGIGFDTQLLSRLPDNHSGLKNIITRAKLLNGSATIESARSLGTKILIIAPYES